MSSPSRCGPAQPLSFTARCAVTPLYRGPGGQRAGLLVIGLLKTPLRWIGLRSYGLYLWHWPVYMVTRPHLDIELTGTPLLMLRLGLTTVFAELSYRFVERPIREHGLFRRGRVRNATPPSRRWSVATRLGLLGAMTASLGTIVVLSLTTGQAAELPPGITSTAVRIPIAATAYRAATPGPDTRLPPLPPYPIIETGPPPPTPPSGRCKPRTRRR